MTLNGTIRLPACAVHMHLSWEGCCFKPPMWWIVEGCTNVRNGSLHQQMCPSVSTFWKGLQLAGASSHYSWLANTKLKGADSTSSWSEGGQRRDGDPCCRFYSSFAPTPVSCRCLVLHLSLSVCIIVGSGSCWIFKDSWKQRSQTQRPIAGWFGGCNATLCDTATIHNVVKSGFRM